MGLKWSPTVIKKPPRATPKQKRYLRALCVRYYGRRPADYYLNTLSAREAASQIDTLKHKIASGKGGGRLGDASPVPPCNPPGA